MEDQKHSGIGIASFITSIVSGILTFLLIVIAGAIEVSTPGGMDEDSMSALIIGLLVIAFMGTNLIALGLGIGGLVQEKKKKIFAILGTIFSATWIVGTISILVLGLSTV